MLLLQEEGSYDYRLPHQEGRCEEYVVKMKMSKGRETTNTIEVELELFLATEKEFSSTQEASTTHSWVTDSGSSHHMTCKKDLYSSM